MNSFYTTFKGHLVRYGYGDTDTERASLPDGEELHIGDPPASLRRPPTAPPGYDYDFDHSELRPNPVVLEKVMRNKRDAVLSSTDWTQGQDAPQATKAKWRAYRQALRDLPQQPGFPENVTWPEPPK